MAKKSAHTNRAKRTSPQGITPKYDDRLANAIDELKETQSQLLQSQKMEAIGRLAGGVAHDFNNLLAVVMMQTDLLLRKFKEPDGVRRRIEEIKRSTERAA